VIHVSKTRLGGRPGFTAYWRETSGKKIFRGIGTTDEVEADETLAVMQRILNTPHLLDPDHKDHHTTPRAAYRAVFQREPPEPSDHVTFEMSHGLPRPMLVMAPDGQILPGAVLPPVRTKHKVRVPALKHALLENVLN